MSRLIRLVPLKRNKDRLIGQWSRRVDMRQWRVMLWRNGLVDLVGGMCGLLLRISLGLVLLSLVKLCCNSRQNAPYNLLVWKIISKKGIITDETVRIDL